jgi:hypothetical protein
MFVRHRGRYQEALESFRDPKTRKPTNRCIARWPLGRTLEDEIAVLENRRASLRQASDRARLAKVERRLAGLRRVRAELGARAGPEVEKARLIGAPAELEHEITRWKAWRAHLLQAADPDRAALAEADKRLAGLRRMRLELDAPKSPEVEWLLRAGAEGGRAAFIGAFGDDRAGLTLLARAPAPRPPRG